MLFADILFIFVFLPLCIGAYFIAKKTQTRNIILLIASLIFYAWGEPTKILLLIAAAAINYLLALAIDLNRGRKAAKVFLIIALVYDIGMLGVFKYTDFFIANINGLFGTAIAARNIALPLGISFYTFQIISYVIDVYWEKVRAQRNFTKLLMYVCLFPQLVAGPIVRYETIAAEIDRRRTTLTDLTAGISRFIMGLAKKVIIANNLSLVVEGLFGEGGINIGSTTVTGAWIGVICYSMQVYFDFSGYSDMAIGMGRIFGFHFDENFNYPFMCRSISEFWQRWHISLGSFFRDYLLYVPIFGKRRQYLSIFLVWFTTGLWHGASWTYVLWGLYFGLFVFIESKIGKKKLKKANTVLMHVYNKLVIILGFGIFYFTDLPSLGTFFKALLGLNGNAFSSAATGALVQKYLWLILFAFIACFPVIPWLKKQIGRMKYQIQAGAQVVQTAYLCGTLYVCTALLVDSFLTNNPFLYFHF